MPCFVGCLALFFPRVAIVLVWLFSTYLHQVYSGLLWLIIGLIFMPMTLLGYAFAWHLGNGQISDFGIVIIVLAVLVDLGIIGGNASNRKVKVIYAGKSKRY